ncbi:hypothetical protein GUJ93_ZPchr0005g15219 [Zizania palustris]|uniref:Uncharacterized protein n=1 Tax=Zizania palustris TaxID=103762 RepID=A0A8J5S1V5_ZIZPA|nr:hypothetical protein GUJ93_ZPchr0005g15219 [Zizania palustris]
MKRSGIGGDGGMRMALGGGEQVGIGRPRLETVGASGGQEEGIIDAAQGRAPLHRGSHGGSERRRGRSARIWMSDSDEMQAGG